MKCNDRFCTKGRPELERQLLPAEHPQALEFSTGPVPTWRWQCLCHWTRFEVAKLEPAIATEVTWTGNLVVNDYDLKTARLSTPVFP
jgi:hypothetical protein